MTEAQKETFVRELISNVQADILRRIPEMPDEWDGHELRRYIADKFDESAITVGRKGPYGRDYVARTRAYRNEVTVRNL